VEVGISEQRQRVKRAKDPLSIITYSDSTGLEMQSLPGFKIITGDDTE